MDYLSLTACIKNEEHYIQEWLCYYKAMGVERFYIFNNNSTDRTEEKIKQLSFARKIKIIPHNPSVKDIQGVAFVNSYKMYAKKTEWMIYCDGDEYFMPTEKQDLRTYIDQYKKYSGFGASWRIYGSSGHILRPRGTALENYVHRANDEWDPNYHVKVIVKPKEVISYLTPHLFETVKGVVNENGEKLDEKMRGRTTSTPAKTIRVNHYFNRSYEDWIDKRRRGRATVKEKRPLEMFDIYDRNEVYDSIGLQYVEDVKKLL